MPITSNIVILVGGPNTGKTQFYNYYTHGIAKPPTVKSTPNIAKFTQPSMVIVDTPGFVNHRNIFEYSWQGIFQQADVILNFGNWSEKEIHGDKFDLNPKMMTWSGDNQETMKRIEEYLQGK